MDEHFYKKKIDIPVYTGKLVLIFTNVINYLPDELGERDHFNACSFFKHNERTKYLEFFIMVNFWNISPIKHGIIAHEVRHAADNIMKYHNIEKQDVDESAAYITGWVTDQVYKFMKKCNISIQ